MEGKINLELKAISWIASFTCGFGIYFLANVSEWDEWAAYIGFGAALLAGGMVDWRTRELERRLPYDQ